ncbi:hypothetical protein M427DRAFT_57378, partial [Gonapodya prolifera JEL478]
MRVLVKEDGKFLSLFAEELKQKKLWKGSAHGSNWMGAASALEVQKARMDSANNVAEKAARGVSL